MPKPPSRSRSVKTPSPLHPFRFNGQSLVAHVSGVLLWPSERTLVVSDLHLEKGASFARSGTFLPPYDTQETLDRLEALLAATKPKTVISLGDSFHDPLVIAALSPDLSNRILTLTSSMDRFIWVRGNHDPDVPDSLGGEVHQDVDFGPLHFRHEATPLFPKPGEISGHWHPKATIRSTQGRTLTRSCFIHDHQRLIMPAFGAYTGGLDVSHPAVVSLFEQNSAPRTTGLGSCSVYLLGKRQINAVPGASLLRR